MQKYGESAMKIEFRIPGFYWGDGLIITNGKEFHGLIANDLILGTTDDNNKIKFSIYFRFPCDDDVYDEYIDEYEFEYPIAFRFGTTFNVQGKNEDSDIVIGMLTVKEIYTNSNIIEITENSISKLIQELGIWKFKKRSNAAQL